MQYLKLHTVIDRTTSLGSRLRSSLSLSLSLSLSRRAAQRRQQQLKPQSGFTIVELLIVIVVIGILAAIVIVAYTGISQRAIVASLQSDLDGASKQLSLYQVDNSAYPIGIDCSATPAANTICLKSSGGTTYTTFSPNNTTNPQTFCLTATNGTTNYFVNQGSTPASGACSITNLATNPSAETSLTGWANRTSSTVSTTTTNPIFGSTSVLATGSVTSTLMTDALSSNWNTAAIPVSSGSAYAARVNVKGLNVPATYQLVMDWFTSTNSYLSSSAGSVSGSIAAGTTTSASVTATAPATAAFLQVYIAIAASSGTLGNQWELDGAMVTQGPTLYNYADGSSPGWAWNGTANASTSTGPPL